MSALMGNWTHEMQLYAMQEKGLHSDIRCNIDGVWKHYAK